MKKKTIKTTITVTLITTALIIAFMIGKSQAKTETKIVATEPKAETYINIDTFEDFYTIETEEGTTLYLYANGNEYVFEN